MKNQNVLKLSLVAGLALLALSEIPAEKYNVYVRTGSTGIVEQEPEEKLQFGGAYSLFSGTVSGSMYSVQSQIRFKLTPYDGSAAVGTQIVLEKANVTLKMPFFTPVSVVCGKGFTQTLAGSFFPLLESYAGGARWGKDGIAVVYSGSAFSGGASLTSGTTAALFSSSLALGSGLQADFAKLCGVPVKAGASCLYNSTGDGSHNSVSIDDFTAAFFVQTAPCSWFTAGAGYTFNGASVAGNTTYQYLSDYKSIGAAHLCDITLSADTAFAEVSAESECGVTMKGDYVPFYSGIQCYVPVYGILGIKPSVQYYAAWNTSDSALSRDSLELYPRLWIESGSHAVSLGAQFTLKQISDGSRVWGWGIPLYYRYKVGEAAK